MQVQRVNRLLTYNPRDGKAEAMKHERTHLAIAITLRVRFRPQRSSGRRPVYLAILAVLLGQPLRCHVMEAERKVRPPISLQHKFH